MPRFSVVVPTRDRPDLLDFCLEGIAGQTFGDYVSVVIDKTVLHPSALDLAARALEREVEVDIVTWRNDGYSPFDEALDPSPGRLLPVASVSPPEPYDPANQLARRFANKSRRGDDPVHYFRGKVVFGP